MAPMAKIRFYAALFTVFMWIGGILSPASSAPAVEVDEHGHPLTAHTDVHAAVDDHGAGGHDQPFILDVDLVSAIVNLVVFLLLLAILAKFVWPPILRGLQQRDAKIRGDLENAERASREAAASLEQYKKQLADAQREAQRIIEESRTNAQRVAEQVREQAEAQAVQMRQRAEADIDAAKQQAISEIYAEAATLATQVAGQILRREVRAEDHRQLVDQSLRELATTQR